ncbi:S8 family serine peptidase [Pontibacter sp. 13R65]|uniref:S8 family serine peptidase n=1 Tax=Pontibacter sp. 13R65 TaxID=3127458 RepID=UPI00301BB4E7
MKGLWLLLVALVTASPAIAQQGITPIRANVEVLKNLSEAANKDFKINRAKAINLANKNGWVIEKTYKDGSHMSLQGLDANGLPVYYITYNNTRAAATTKTDQLWAGGGLGLNLSGANSSVSNKLGVWDAGRILETHQELRGRVVQKDNASATPDDHATHVAGTLVASGVNGFAKGMAFGVRQLQAYDYNNDVSEMAAAANNLLVSNHSYGSIAGWRYNSDRKGTKEDPYWEWWGDGEISDTVDYKFGYYSDVATSWDRIAFNAPYYLIVKSAGNNRNDNGPVVGEPYYKRSRNGNFTLVASRPANISNNNGYDNIPTYGTAKNILTVGAVAAIPNGYNRPSDVAISAFSSFGPTDDGRIKPDIVGNGVAVLSTSSTGDFAYRSSNGTSMASPNVAGTLLLLQEHYANLNNGAAMRAATLKGLAIHTADEAGPAPGPDYSHGWGLLNADKAATVISNTNQSHLVQERSLNQSQVYTLQVVASGYGPLVATICWADPEATATPIGKDALNNRTPRLVNDLDLRISGRGTTYLPWTLNPLNPAEAAHPGDNTLDNVEQITIANAVPGETYTIRISHKGTLRNGKQDYSLLVSGVGGKAYCASAPSSDAGARINSFALGSYAHTMPGTGCSTLRDYTAAAPIFFEPGQTQQLTITTGSCGAAAATAAKAFFDWNNNGSFTDAGEEVVLAGTGTLTGNVTAPNYLIAGNKVRMRLVLQETEDISSISACGSYPRGETQEYVVQLIRQQNDVGITAISIPGGSLCATPDQALVVRVRNFGEAAQKDILVSVNVLQNGNQVATLTGIYNRTLAPFSEEEFLMEGSFPTEAGASYELIATSALESDIVPANNRLSRTIAISAAAAPPQASAVRCGTSSQFTLNSSGGSSTYWYTSADATTPVAAGHQLSADLGQVGSSLFVALNDFSGTVGPATKSFATGGGYNQFTPDVLVTTNAPMLLESARLYIGHSGRITFTAFNADGAPVSSRTLNVVATRTTPGTGVQPDDPADTGAVYYLGLALPEAGEYRIGIAYEGGATIYRNNEGVEGYPFGLPNVFTITGSSANPGPLSYYYYLYDLKIKALGCPSERAPAEITTGASIPQPVVTRNGKTLLSSAATGNRWYLNGRLLVGATGNTFTPEESGSYSVMASAAGCISDMSVPYSYIHRPDVQELGPELLVSPNPSSGRFRLELETEQAEDITFEVTDMVGHLLYTGKVEQRNGQFEGFVDLSGRASGVYLLRVQHGSRQYTRKLVVQR